MRTSPRAVSLTALSALAVLLMACQPGAGASATATQSVVASASASGSEAAACATDTLQTKTPDTFTIGTDNPNFPPYFAELKKGEKPPAPWDGFDPTSGKGFESAVAYALAEQLGFAKDQVTWRPVTFNNAIAPGPKDFDVYISQVSFTEERTKAVDLSEGYWFSNQALVTNAGSPLAKATTIEEVAKYRLAAQINTTSLAYIQDKIHPDQEPRIYDDNTAVKTAIEAGQVVDGAVFDLATAFYIANVEMDNGVVVGQFPSDPAEKEHFSFLLDLDSPLTDCVNEAILTMGENGELDEISAKWMADYVNAPFITE